MLNRLFPEGSRGREFFAAKLVRPRILPHLSQNFVKSETSGLEQIQASLERNYFSKEPDGYLLTEEGRIDLDDHLLGRLEESRKFVIPWLDRAKPLKKANILEIGCGTGCSTVSLAEQGAQVTALDIDEKSLIVAETRCRIYQVEVDFYRANATEIARLFGKEKFDFIIFWASLEHMTHDERISAMKDSWDMLPRGSLWGIIETPNRLWYYDEHTSRLPFFHWLPDDLAVKYARFSPRELYRENCLHSDGGEEDLLHFFRWGRGVSYHEFALTMKPPSELQIVSCLELFRRKRLFYRLKRCLSRRYLFEAFLKKVSPEIHQGFFQEHLNLLIEKG